MNREISKEEAIKLIQSSINYKSSWEEVENARSLIRLIRDNRSSEITVSSSNNGEEV